MLERIPYIDKCDTLGQKTDDNHSIHMVGCDANFSLLISLSG
jgi:hypothetical protein